MRRFRSTEKLSADAEHPGEILLRPAEIHVLAEALLPRPEPFENVGGSLAEPRDGEADRFEGLGRGARREP